MLFLFFFLVEIFRSFVYFYRVRLQNRLIIYITNDILKKIKLNHVPAAAARSLQSCPTLCDPIDGSPPGSPVPGILQARTLEWVAIAISKIEA